MDKETGDIIGGVIMLSILFIAYSVSYLYLEYSTAEETSRILADEYKTNQEHMEKQAVMSAKLATKEVALKEGYTDSEAEIISNKVSKIVSETVSTTVYPSDGEINSHLYANDQIDPELEESDSTE